MNTSQDKQDNKLLKGVVLLLLAAALVVVAIFFVFDVVSRQSNVSSTMIQYQLDNVQDLVTQKFTYTDKAELSGSRQLLSYDIPFTRHSVQIIYSGVIKAGFDVQDLDIEIEHREHIIYLRLPAVTITDNYILQDSIQYIERNNILNPLHPEEINDFLESLQEGKADAAIEAGLLTEAEKNAKKVISDCLSVFSDYTVQFR